MHTSKDAGESETEVTEETVMAKRSLSAKEVDSTQTPDANLRIPSFIEAAKLLFCIKTPKPNRALILTRWCHTNKPALFLKKPKHQIKNLSPRQAKHKIEQVYSDTRINRCDITTRKGLFFINKEHSLGKLIRI